MADSYIDQISRAGVSYDIRDSEVQDWARGATKPSYTKSEVGLGNVDNTADANKNVATAEALSSGAKIGITGGATAAGVNFDGSGDINLIVTSLDATKLSGTVPLSSIPKGAVSEEVVVANYDAMLALTYAQVQQGDTVKLNDTGVMYYVKDDTKLGSAAAFDMYKAGEASSVDWANVKSKPSSFTPSSHTHPMSDIDELTTALAGKSDTGHGHSMSDITGLSDALGAKADADAMTTALAGKSDTGHGHTMSDITGLSDALAGKAAATHTHAISDVTGLQDALNGTSSSTHGHGNISNTGTLSSASVVVVTDGTKKIGVSTITTTKLGYLSDVTSNIQAQINAKAASSHTHAMSDITGLSDALAGKAAATHGHEISEITDLSDTLAGKAAASHSHAITDITNLQTTLNAKAASTHTHGNITNAGAIGTDSGLIVVTTTSGVLTAKTIANAGLAAASHSHAMSDITGLSDALAGKAASSHSHAIADITNLQTTLNAKAASDHVHGNITNAGAIGSTSGLIVVTTTNGVLTTSTITTTKLGYLSGVTSDIQTQLNAKAASSHSHAISEITNLQSTLDAKATTAKWTNLSIATGWSGSAAPYTKTLTVSGILATDVPVIDFRATGTYSTDKTAEEAWCNVYRAVTSANTITFYAHEAPTVAIPVTIQVTR